MQKGSKYFLILVVVLVVISVFYTSYKTLIKKDFTIIEDENPVEE